MSVDSNLKSLFDKSVIQWYKVVEKRHSSLGCA